MKRFILFFKFKENKINHGVSTNYETSAQAQAKAFLMTQGIPRLEMLRWLGVAGLDIRITTTWLSWVPPGPRAEAQLTSPTNLTKDLKTTSSNLRVSSMCLLPFISLVSKNKLHEKFVREAFSTF